MNGSRHDASDHLEYVGATDTVDTSSFPARAESVRAARVFTAERLHAIGADAQVPVVALIVSELATNAVRHARSTFDVAVTTCDDRVRVSVRDCSANFPNPSSTAVRSGGRGLEIVSGVSSRWGWESSAGGKVVWAEVHVD